MRRVGKLAAFAFCFVMVFGAGCSPDTAGTHRVSIAPTAVPPKQPGFQTISGLGVNANVHSWNNGELKPAIDKIAELGDVTWRVIIDKADWETAEYLDSTGPIDWSHYKPIYENGKMADLWDTIAYINSKPRQQVMVNVMGGVPDWMGGSRIDGSHEDQWVQMIASMVAYGRTVRGLDFTLLGPMNETDWNGVEGPQVAAEQYVRLLHKLIIRLDGLGLDDMRLVGPDTASASKAVTEYLPALVVDPLVMSRVAHFGIHSYDGEAEGTASALSKSTDPNGDFWVTEYSGPCPGCDNGAPNPTDWSSAASSADYAINLLEQGAAGLQQYDAWDGYYEHHESMGYWGLLAYDPATGTYHPRKTYYVLQQLIKNTPRNSVRVDASTDQAQVGVVAFQDPLSGRVTLFGRNTSDQAVTARLRSPSLGAGLELATFATDSGRNMEAGSPAFAAESAVTYTAGPGTVFTLTGIPTKG